MTLSEVYYDRVIGAVIAAAICLAGCSKQPVTDTARGEVTTSVDHPKAELTHPWARFMAPVTNTTSTARLFRHTSPPPWDAGNFLTFRFFKAPVPGQMEEWVEWDVVNLHSENFAEITSRLKLTSVELHVLPTGSSLEKFQEHGRPERTITSSRGYAIVTDARIPQSWFLSEPGKSMGIHGPARLDPDIAQRMRAAFPENFRALPKP